MKSSTGPATDVLRPILDMYMDAAVAVVGCRAKGIQRDSCEWDVVVVTREKSPQTSLKLGGAFVDLSFMSEKEALTPTNPEHALSFASAKPVRDTGLILSTSSAANSATIPESSRRAGATRLASALKTVGRAEEALSSGSVPEADLWLVAASYEFAYSWLYSRELTPSPSHLLSQLKEMPKGSDRYFEAFSRGAGLERATRAGCGSRLEGLGVLHDVIVTGPQGRATRHSAWSSARLDIVDAKARDLASGIELAECYSYMGQELVDYVQAITVGGSRGTPKVRDLFSEKEPVLAGRLLKQLGLSRSKDALMGGLVLLKDEVSRLAREV